MAQFLHSIGNKVLWVVITIIFSLSAQLCAEVISDFSDCSTFDREMRDCLQCSVEKSDWKEFQRNFKEIVDERVCQTHIGSYGKDLIYDSNAEMYYAFVFLNTQYTTIQYTEKVLFEVEYNCESDRVCSMTKFFAVKLGNLKPVHRQTLKNFPILFPLEGLRDSKMRVVKVRSHSQDACGGNFSSFNLSTIDIKSKQLSARRSKKCPDNNEILITSSNISIPAVVVAKTTPSADVDPSPNAGLLVRRKKEIWFETHWEAIIGVVAAFVIVVVIVVVLTLFFCRTDDCNFQRIRDRNQVPRGPGIPAPNPERYANASTETNVDESSYEAMTNESFDSHRSSMSGQPHHPVLLNQQSRQRGAGVYFLEQTSSAARNDVNSSLSQNAYQRPSIHEDGYYPQTIWTNSRQSSGDVIMSQIPSPPDSVIPDIPDAEPTGDTPQRLFNNRAFAQDPQISDDDDNGSDVEYGDDLSVQNNDVVQGESLPNNDVESRA